MVFGSAEFERPSGSSRARFGVWFNAAYFLVLGIWAVAGSWRRYPALGLISGIVYLEFCLAAVRRVGFGLFRVPRG